MNKGNLSRRGFMQQSLTAMAAAGLPTWYAREVFALADETKKPAVSPITMGAIGIGSPQSRGRAIMHEALGKEGVQYVAICDVDARHREQAVKDVHKAALDAKKESVPDIKKHEDFRELLDNKNIQAVTIATPDHWHVLVAIEALRKARRTFIARSR